MKYVSYTFIDDATQIPVSVEPAKKGPIMPEGVTYVFSAEQSFSTGIPQFYGTSQKSLSWMKEYSETDFIEIFKRELKERVSLKRKLFLSSATVEIESCQFDYSKETINGLTSVLNTMTLDKTIQHVDFSINGRWLILDLKQAKLILKQLNKNIQKLYSWCASLEREIDSCTTIEDCTVIQSKLLNFNIE